MVLGDMYPKFTLSIPNLDVFDDDPNMVKMTVALNFDIRLPQSDVSIEFRDKGLTMSKSTSNFAG